MKQNTDGEWEEFDTTNGYTEDLIMQAPAHIYYATHEKFSQLTDIIV